MYAGNDGSLNQTSYSEEWRRSELSLEVIGGVDLPGFDWLYVSVMKIVKYASHDQELKHWLAEDAIHRVNDYKLVAYAIITSPRRMQALISLHPERALVLIRLTSRNCPQVNGFFLKCIPFPREQPIASDWFMQWYKVQNFFSQGKPP